MILDLELVIESPLKLPQIDKLPRQNETFHRNPCLFNYHAWMLSAKSELIKVFHSKLPSMKRKSIRPSSQTGSTNRWPIFNGYCTEKQINLLKISAVEVMEFFIQLLEFKNFYNQLLQSTFTIKGIERYREVVPGML